MTEYNWTNVSTIIDKFKYFNKWINNAYKKA